MDSSSTLVIHQALHGYNDGHRLLQSSTRIPDAVARQMLVMSDLSGTGMVKGFEEYLTAYPLLETRYYAFAKTWYASEMPRPGCVWTHTLLMSFESIGRVFGLDQLRVSFVRPSKDVDRADYQRPVTLRTSADVPEGPSVPIAVDLAAEVLTLLYDGGGPVLLPANNAKEYEDLVLAVWSQAWPALRQNLSLCTGALASRNMSGKPLVLQIIPASSVRQITRELPQGKVVQPAALTGTRPPQWAVSAGLELLREQTDVRKLLWHAGEFVDADRPVFPRAFQVCMQLRSVQEKHVEIDSLLQSLNTHFADPHDVPDLKRTILTPTSEHACLFVKRAEVEILEALATTEYYTAFDAEGLKLRARAGELWRTASESAAALLRALVGRELTPLGEQILIGLLITIDVEQARMLAKAIPGLLAMVARLNPDIGASPDVWHEPADAQREVFDSLTSSHALDVGRRQRIVSAMLEAGSDVVARGVIQKFGADAVVPVLEWLNTRVSSQGPELPQAWHAVVASFPSSALQWLAETQHVEDPVVESVVSTLNPHSSEVRRFGAELWLRLIPEAAPGLVPSGGRRVYAFALAIAFDGSERRADDLAVRVFDEVHESLAQNRLSYASWLLLADAMPSLVWWRNWDKCERLRQGLVTAFVRHRWPPSQFVRCTSRTATLQRLLDSCYEVKGGTGFVRRLKADLSHSDTDLGDDQREILARY